MSEPTTSPRRPSPPREYIRALLGPDEMSTARAESYRILRTNLQLLDREGSCRVVLITSAGRGEGKSVTTANLALTLAHAGLRVLVIDADLRLPTQHRLFGVPDSQTGVVQRLADLTSGAAESNEFDTDGVTPLPDVAFTAAENLWVLPSGAATDKPAELLGSEAFQLLLEEARASFDYVLVDCSPAGLVTDATLAAAGVDGVLLVLAHGQDHRRFVRRTVHELSKSGAVLLGIVLNRYPRRRGRRGDRAYLGGEYYGRK